MTSNGKTNRPDTGGTRGYSDKYQLFRNHCAFRSFSFSLQVKAQEDDSAALIAIIDAVEKGWEQADGQPFREHYLNFEGARYIESGGQNDSLTDLIEHHVEPDGDALDSLELDLSNVEVKATVKRDQREIHNRDYETFLLRRVDGKWMIIHTHSSSRPVKSEQ